MDPEQTFLRVHARLSGMLSQLLTPRIRLALEYLYLAGAVALFCLLVVMHTNFVQQVSIRPPRPSSSSARACTARVRASLGVANFVRTALAWVRQCCQFDALVKN